jgi:hypothetical protein
MSIVDPLESPKAQKSQLGTRLGPVIQATFSDYSYRMSIQKKSKKIQILKILLNTSFTRFGHFDYGLVLFKFFVPSGKVSLLACHGCQDHGWLGRDDALRFLY